MPIDGNLVALSFFALTILLCLRRCVPTPRALFFSTWAIRICWVVCISALIGVFCEVRRPVINLVAIAMLSVFLVESMRLWCITRILIKCGLPVFPSYERGSENFIWPIGEFFNRTREMLIASGFREQISLQIGDKSPFVAHSPVFYDGDHLVRLQIIFASPRGNFLSCILTSFMKSGDSVVTSNLNAIFTSFLPKSWHALRRPMASLDTLIRVHRKRIAKMDIKKFGRGDILQAINGELAELEKKNCELGFCERVGGNSHATLTFEGRYHLWSEMLQCAYFGKIF